jgi:hypothetical protein
MLRAFCILIALAVPTRAQFFGLATPADGSTVYFATPLRLKDTVQPDYGKLFRVAASEFAGIPPLSSGRATALGHRGSRPD